MGDQRGGSLAIKGAAFTLICQAMRYIVGRNFNNRNRMCSVFLSIYTSNIRIFWSTMSRPPTRSGTAVLLWLAASFPIMGLLLSSLEIISPAAAK